jgi:hypothetical protein
MPKEEGKESGRAVIRRKDEEIEQQSEESLENRSSI